MTIEFTQLRSIYFRFRVRPFFRREQNNWDGVTLHESITKKSVALQNICRIDCCMLESKHWQHWWVDCLWVWAGKMVLNGDLRLFASILNLLLFKQTVQSLIRRRILRCLIWVCTVCQCSKCPSPGFTDSPLSTTLWRHSDKKSAAINNRYMYLDFFLTRGLITVVNDNHVDNYLKEILAFVYYGSIANNQPKSKW